MRTHPDRELPSHQNKYSCILIASSPVLYGMYKKDCWERKFHWIREQRRTSSLRPMKASVRPLLELQIWEPQPRSSFKKAKRSQLRYTNSLQFPSANQPSVHQAPDQHDAYRSPMPPSCTPNCRETYVTYWFFLFLAAILLSIALVVLFWVKVTRRYRK